MQNGHLIGISRFKVVERGGAGEPAVGEDRRLPHGRQGHAGPG